MPLKKMIQKGHVYHVYYRRSGGYKFFFQYFWKLLLALVILGGTLWAIDRFVYSLEDFGNFVVNTFSPAIVLLIFYVAEVCTGFLPPEVLFPWASQMPEPYLIVLLMVLASLAGGITSYFIGTRLYRLPRVMNWVDDKFKIQFEYIKRYGGLLIFMAAISPLPYPTVSMIAGIVKYNFRNFLFLSIGRFLKFFLTYWLVFENI